VNITFDYDIIELEKLSYEFVFILSFFWKEGEELENYNPPCTITEKMVHQVAEISELIGRADVMSRDIINPSLRRENRIRTIQSSLAIENNTLTLDQVTAILEGKRILGDPSEIKEVQNAFQAYEILLTLNPYSVKDLLNAHKILMNDLVKEAGVFRSGGVGIFAGEMVVHMAPPSNMVYELISDLFAWYKTSEIHPLIKSCIFHYEFEFIHPFADGNGRIGRMWHTLLLSRWKELLGWLPVETLVRERQDEYYKVLGISDKNTDSSVFVEYMLQAVLDALRETIQSDQVRDQVSDQVKKLIKVMDKKVLSSVEIMKRLGLVHKATFRKNYLNPALEANIIERIIPDKPKSSRQKYRMKSRRLNSSYNPDKN
jgi:Fic family protein